MLAHLYPEDMVMPSFFYETGKIHGHSSLLNKVSILFSIFKSKA